MKVVMTQRSQQLGLLTAPFIIVTVVGASTAVGCGADL